ncbi:MAG: hypothetical protein R2705_06060 [Ilumatobacteraceae bacterium]
MATITYDEVKLITDALANRAIDVPGARHPWTLLAIARRGTVDGEVTCGDRWGQRAILPPDFVGAACHGDGDPIPFIQTLRLPPGTVAIAVAMMTLVPDLAPDADLDDPQLEELRVSLVASLAQHADWMILADGVPPEFAQTIGVRSRLLGAIHTAIRRAWDNAPSPAVAR